MTAQDFVYWLQGHFELNPDQKQLTPAQTELVRRHLNMVFFHEIDPSYGDKAHQDKLKALHWPQPTPEEWEKIKEELKRIKKEGLDKTPAGCRHDPFGPKINC